MHTVLIVDDEPLVLTLLHRVLTEIGFSTLVAASGPEALRLADSVNGRFELLLTDLKMPEMGGQELTAEVLKRYPKVRVAYMSGFCDRAASGLDALEGSGEFLQKPFSRTSLIAKLSSVFPEAFWPEAAGSGTTANG